MTRRVFIDTSWNSKPHICYDPEKDVFFEVNDLRELPEEYDEIYLDSSIFPNMWEQIKPLIYNGRRVFYFTRPWKWREIRGRFKEEMKAKTGRASKTDKGDSFLLYKVYELSLVKGNTNKYFRELSIVDVELRPLLMMEQALYKNLQRLQRLHEVVDVSNDIEEYERRLKNVRREIVDKAVDVIPRFIEIAEALGLSSEDINGLTGLAGLLTYIGYGKESLSINKKIRYLGLFKAKSMEGKAKKKCNRKVARYCNLLTLSILRKNNQYIPALRDLRMTLKQLINLLRQDGSAVASGGGLG